MLRKGRRIVWGSEWPRAECRLSGFGGKETKPVLGAAFHGLGAPGATQHGVADLSAPSAALETPLLCQNKSCPVNYCHNHGHCYISQTEGCQPTCTCPPAFTDSRCFLAGNSFTPTISLGSPRCPRHPYFHTPLALGGDEGAWGPGLSSSNPQDRTPISLGGGKL